MYVVKGEVFRQDALVKTLDVPASNVVEEFETAKGATFSQKQFSPFQKKVCHAEATKNKQNRSK